MMVGLNLQPNEVVLFQNMGAYESEGRVTSAGELYLTNRNIIYISKSAFGRNQGIKKYQLSHIKVMNQLPQVTMGKNSRGINELVIYFNTEQKGFYFVEGKREISKWIKAIHKAIAGEMDLQTQNSGIMAIPGTEHVAETVRDTIGVFKSTFGVKEKVENITTKCIGCGAPLSGIRGTQICCKYCDTTQTL